MTALRTALGVATLTLAATLGMMATAHAQTTQGPLQGQAKEPVANTPTDEAIWAIDQSLWVGPGVGEDYIVEVGAGFWNPTPTISAASEQFGIEGTTIDFGRDLGLARQSHREFDMTFKPGRRHKLRVNWMPMHYQQSGVLPQEVIFQGIRYDAGLPVNSAVSWTTWRLGYEFDVIVRDRGYVGLILEAKLTDVRAELQSPVDSEFARARAPIPAFGAITRVYVTRFTPVTVEVTAFQMPDDLVKDYRARLVDFDVYGTINLTRMFGLNLGYRSIDMSYLFERDSGDFKVNGMYVSGAFRF